MNERQKSNAQAVAALAAERMTNGDPGGEDRFDGGCPSDTIVAVPLPLSADRELDGTRWSYVTVGSGDYMMLGAFPYLTRAEAEAALLRVTRAAKNTRGYVLQIKVPA